MEVDKETEKKVEEIQSMEMNLQNLLMQRQSGQVELNEIDNALSEVKKSKDEVYKLFGNVLLKAEKDKVIKELEEKKKILEMKINAVEKQEKLIENRAEKLRKEINEKIRKK